MEEEQQEPFFFEGQRELCWVEAECGDDEGGCEWREL